MKGLAFVAIAAVFSGCATHPDHIRATPVHINTFDDWSCDQLASAYDQYSAELAALEPVQRRAASEDTMGVLWTGLPLGSMTTGDAKVREQKIADARGQRDALHAARTLKGCYQST